MEKGRALDDDEVDFIVVLIMDWIKGQLQRFEKLRVKNRYNIIKKRESLPSFTTVNSPSLI